MEIHKESSIKSASQHITEDQMLSNLILRLYLANINIRCSENELERLELDGQAHSRYELNSVERFFFPVLA
jgi:hypothetical protein